MLEKSPTPQERTDIDKLSVKIDSLIQLQSRTNDLLTQAINNDIAHFKSLRDTQNGNTAKISTGLNVYHLDNTEQRVSIDNLSYWLSHIHNRLQELQELQKQSVGMMSVDGMSKQSENTNILLQKILDVMTASVDAGEYRIIKDTATTTVTIYDFEKEQPYHPVFGYIIVNDSTTTINVAVNDSSKFYELKAKESDTITRKEATIKKIFINTDSGTAAYRLRVLW